MPLACDTLVFVDPPLAAPPRPPTQTPDDCALTLADTSLLVEDALPDWDGDPVIADFMDALLRLELDEEVAGSGGATAPIPDDEGES
jgi:hypothetical protein